MDDIINDLEIVLRRIEQLNGFGEEAEVIDYVISLLKEQEPRVLTLEEAQTAVGHGWEECWMEADEEMPESIELYECVFIRGNFICADGDIGQINPDTYGKPYHSRLWMGDIPPTDEQRKGEKWNG